MNFSLLKAAFNTTPYKRLIVFGSQARNDAGKGSDVDILVVLDKTLTFAEKGTMASMLRKRLAQKSIDADIVIHSEEEVDRYKQFPGSVVRNALKEGITL